MLNDLYLNKDDIKILALSPRLAFDDESLSIVLVTCAKKRHEIKYRYLELGYEEIEAFEKFFELENRISDEWSKFSYEDHQRYEIKIIQPAELYWVDLLDNGTWNRLIKFLKFFRLIWVSSGRLNSKVKAYLESIEI